MGSSFAKYFATKRGLTSVTSSPARPSASVKSRPRVTFRVSGHTTANHAHVNTSSIEALDNAGQRVTLLSIREWILLLAKKRAADLRETAPVWLPHYELSAERPLHLFSLLALAFALARELSGESAIAREHAALCNCGDRASSRSSAGSGNPLRSSCCRSASRSMPLPSSATLTST